MQIGQLLNKTLLKYPQLDENELKLIVMKVNNIADFTTYILNRENEAKRIGTFNRYVRALRRGKPVQYILKEAYFFDTTYKVNRKVLIPRIETEELTRIVLDEIKNKANITVADVGTGSGVIAATLKKHSSANVFASDLSKKALNVAKKNCNGLNINFLNGDLLIPYIKQNIKLDYIVANLPYIKHDEIIDKKVKRYEPKLALYWPKIHIFIRLFSQINDINKGDNGLSVFLEIGTNQARELTSLAQMIYGKDAKIEVRKDLNNKERFLIIRGIK